MLNNPTIEKLENLKLNGMIRALGEQEASSEAKALSFMERLGLLTDRELTDRENRRLELRLRTAKLRQQGVIEDIDYRHPRQLDKSLMKSLAACTWIKDRLNVLITGATGVGKSFIACALAHQACREGLRVLYFRSGRLFEDLALGRGDGRYPKLMNNMAKADLLILDDWGLTVLGDQGRSDLLEILEDRHDLHSTIITSQLPVESWHEMIGNPTLADAILDRLIHNAYTINLKGGSMRKKRSDLT